MVQINAGHTVTSSTGNTTDIKNMYVFNILSYLNGRQLILITILCIDRNNGLRKVLLMIC